MFSFHVNAYSHCLSQFSLSLTIWLLWPLCPGDIHPKPGPSSISSSLNSSTSNNHSNNSLRSLHLCLNNSFVHYKVQSSLNKLDILKAGHFEFDIMILAFTETWFNAFAAKLPLRTSSTCSASSFSEWVYTKAGVPQGSILGPLLLLLYTNDIVKKIGSNISLLADDTSLFIILDNPTTAAL